MGSSAAGLVGFSAGEESRQPINRPVKPQNTSRLYQRREADATRFELLVNALRLDPS